MVSILITTLDKLNYLKLACRSIEENTTIPFEIIIWDNSTSDEVKRWAEGKYVCLGEGKNSGLSGTLNRLVERSSYPMIFFSDNDYYFLPGWDSVVTEAMEHDAWRSPMQIFGCTGKSGHGIEDHFGHTPETFREEQCKEKYVGTIHPDVLHYLILPCVLSKRDFDAIGRFDEDVFLSEFSFDWRAREYYEGRGKRQITCPISFIYHFGSSTPRPPNYRPMAYGAKDQFKADFGVTEEAEAAFQCQNYSIIGPSQNSDGSLIDYGNLEG